MYQLEPYAGLLDSEFRRRLLVDGKFTGVVVVGDEIGQVFHFGNLTLVTVHYDFFEGVDHRFYLLDEHGRLLDCVAPPSYFGFMQNVARESANCVSFGFFGTEDRWKVTVVPAGYRAFRWSFKLYAKRFLRLEPLR